MNADLHARVLEALKQQDHASQNLAVLWELRRLVARSVELVKEASAFGGGTRLGCLPSIVSAAEQMQRQLPRLEIEIEARTSLVCEADELVQSMVSEVLESEGRAVGELQSDGPRPFRLERAELSLVSDGGAAEAQARLVLSGPSNLKSVRGVALMGRLVLSLHSTVVPEVKAFVEVAA
jgi:hypothetical protein